MVDLFSSIGGIVVALIVFAILVLIHESGHFAVAKWSGIPVFEFAIGMGPVIFKKQKNETLYSVRLFPIGGFCRMDEDVGGAFNKASPWRRFLVLFAGAFLNIVLGFFIFLILSGSSPQLIVPVIDTVIPNTNLAQADIMAGDRIVALNNTKINIYDDVGFFMQRITPDPIQLTVERNGENITAQVLPVLQEITYTPYEDEIQIDSVVNGVLQSSIRQPLKESGISKDFLGQTATEKRYIIGFTPQRQNNSAWSTVREAFYSTVFNAKVVYVSLYSLITGAVSYTELMGPVGIINLLGDASKAGWRSLLGLMALLTINLGVFNLLPLPALDGGRILFVGVEAIRRKPIEPEKEGMVHFVGFILLIGLILLVTFNDVSRLFGSWIQSIGNLFH